MNETDAVLGLEPEDLDGHTIDDLHDYLERGRRPADPSIDDSPACQIALGALDRLRDAAGALIASRPDDARHEDDWIAGAIARVSLEARAGKHFPLRLDEEGVDAVVTQGALRGLVRTVGDEVAGLLIGSVRIDPDEEGRTASLAVDVAVVHGAVIPEAVHRLRAALTDALPDHLPFAVGRIDVRVAALLQLEGWPRA